MINKDLLSSIFENYGIGKVVLVEDANKFNFIISNMSESFNLDRWEYLENILKDITKREITIIPLNQALKNFNSSYLEKGVIIK